MKKNKIIYWTATGIIVLMEGLMPALTSHTEMAKEGLHHLGYPAYFGVILAAFKVLGALALALPQVSRRIKEWAYAGFSFDFIAAAISHWAVEGFGSHAAFPFIILGILAVSYVFLDKIVSKSEEIAYSGNEVSI